ncbi:hypothetical protein BV25DRAFT_1915993 [Artomyces pyxidatus]|uniref:Uncharacterized protein n=1 Tax=Artomyces pyxidatus TaxID=48021 RepID=A0ACB8T111_9AGAM|nr:hypothetical protein BV25DRAFT_1915993 [Artomyces pyxidatus]
MTTGAGNASAEAPNLHEMTSDDLQPRNLTKQEQLSIKSAVDQNTITQIVQIWSDRLQLISVYASFFTSIDSLLFSLSAGLQKSDTIAKVTNAALVGALIFHAAAAILAYITSFVVIRYKLNETTHPESPSVSASISARTPGRTRTPHAAETAASPAEKQPSLTFPTSPVIPFFSTRLLSLPLPPLLHPPMSRTIVIHRLHFFTPKNPDEDSALLMSLLVRCHTVCSTFALAGFVLVMVGVISYVWAALERAVSIFASACVATTLAVGLVALY